MFQIDFTSRKPIYEQLYDDVIRLASVGALKSGDKLPPVRALASQLGINPNTAAKAYKQLESDGYIYTSVGRGSFITDRLSAESAGRLTVIQKFISAAEEAIKFGFSREELIQIIKNAGKGGNSVD